MKHREIRGLALTQSGPKRGADFEMEQEDRNGVKELGGGKRAWQLEAFKLLKNMRFAFCTAFCGSGKSMLQVCLAAHDYAQSEFAQRQLFVVPQSVIAQGFVGDGEARYIRIKLGRKEYTWQFQPNHNFCDDNATGVIVALREWLLKPVSTASKRLGSAGTLTGGIAIATHQALSLAWATLSNAERKRAIHKLTLRVDEAHHIKGVFDEDADGYTPEEMSALEEEATHLGDICREILNSDDATAKLHLTTATPYRGDRGIILSPKAISKFNEKGVGARYFLPWLQHWPTLGIEQFTIQYEEYSKDPFKEVVDRIKQEPNERHMIVVPATGLKWRTDAAAYERFLKALYRVVPKSQVLDLVTPTEQARSKAKLAQEPKYGGESAYRVVVTCMIGREGLDWVPCSRLHNTAVERSLTLAVQTSGRPLRKYGPKRTVKIFNYVPELRKGLKPEEKRQFFSDRSNGVLLGMQWDDLTESILVRELPINKGSKATRNVTLNEVFGSEYPTVMEAIMEEISSLDDITDEGVQSACACVLEEITPHGRYDDEELMAALRRAVLRRLQWSQSEDVQERLRLRGIDISFLREEEGFDKVIAEFGINSRAWFVGEHGESDWKELRAILRRKVQDFEEQCREVAAYLNRKTVTA